MKSRENAALVEEFRALCLAGYKELLDAADGLEQKVAMEAGQAILLDELARIERDFRNERRRDHFRSPLHKVADAATRDAS